MTRGRKSTCCHGLVQTGFLVKVDFLLENESVHVAQDILNDTVPARDSRLAFAFQIMHQQAAEEGVVQRWIPDVESVEQTRAKRCTDDPAKLLNCHGNEHQLPRSQIRGREILKHRVLSLETK